MNTPLEPGLKALLALPEFQMARPPPGVTAAMLRAAARANPWPTTTPDPVHEVRDLSVPVPGGTVATRLFRPEAARDLPLVVYFHGGAWVFCDLDTHEPLCRTLARVSGCVVVSVDYRLAPEHPFPMPLEDCYHATHWLAQHAGELGVDATRLAVAGDSAGGNLAAGVTRLARARGLAICYQALIYPVTDASFEHASWREFGHGYLLERDVMEWAWECYVPDAARRDDPLASPLNANDCAGLPPATIITADHDPLRDEGEAYGARLRESGVTVMLRRYLGVVHGFASLPSASPSATRALADVAGDLRAALAPG
jgi:acetyl esterase